ncbi:hypothetical protein [Nocardia transvalensis]|uniref:hypothetical protein n=1 Tax=Nocardia transvalensis TaxID=37333 RepID=UPI001E50D5BA|nr:hypothetical protein [Nocardia transvalensis]
MSPAAAPRPSRRPHRGECPEPDDDIGIVGTLNFIPRDVLAVCFGIPETAFGQIPTDIKPVVITKRPR